MNKSCKAVVSIILCIALTCILPLSVYAEMPGKSDAPGENIFRIATVREFLEFSQNCRLNSYSVGLTAILEEDIDLTGQQFDGIPTFSGVFDGGGHSITGVSVSGSGSVQGFFRYLQPSAAVYDLKIEGVILPGGSHNTVGGIAGSNAGVISGCIFTGQVSGAKGVGGVAGRNEITGIIEACKAFDLVHGDHFVGGIAGENLGVIRSCENYAEVNTTVSQNSVEISDVTVETLTGSESPGTTTDIGGITGGNSGVVRDCVNRVNIGYPHIGYNIGGIAGSQTGYITGCSNYGEIFGRKEVGGIVGQMEPSTSLEYRPDTIQKLYRQLGSMSSLVDSAAASARNSSDEIRSQADELRGQVDGALAAVGQLIPDSGESLPDEDSALAALNNLSSAMSSIPGTIGGITESGKGAVSSVTNDLGAIAEQMKAIGATVGSSSADMGGSYADVSDEDTDEHLSGKVEECVNYANVQADINVGGIVGAMAIENDLDHESDVHISGSMSANFSCETRAVVVRCENTGTVSAKRQNAGGIAGWMSMGLLRDCINTGAVEAQAAEHIGGIAGLSEGYIRRCSAKCALEGAAYVGGIAGEGNTLSDCISMIDLRLGSEKLGAIMGYSEAVLEAGEDGPQVESNYYLAVESDIGGVDGISYEGAAQPLGTEDFYALEGLPDSFRSITVRFVFENGDVQTVGLAPGDKLTSADIPEIPERKGYTGSWAGLDEIDPDNIFYDLTFDLEYIPFESTIQSENVSENGLPILLAQGEFSQQQTIFLGELDAPPVLPEEQALIEGWEFTLSAGESEIKLRYLLPGEYPSDDVLLLVRDESGDWHEAEFTADGSYLLFHVNDGERAFCAVHAPGDNLLLMLCIGAGVLILAVTAVILSVRIKRKKSKGV